MCVWSRHILTSYHFGVSSMFQGNILRKPSKNHNFKTKFLGVPKRLRDEVWYPLGEMIEQSDRVPGMARKIVVSLKRFKREIRRLKVDP